MIGGGGPHSGGDLYTGKVSGGTIQTSERPKKFHAPSTIAILYVIHGRVGERGCAPRYRRETARPHAVSETISIHWTPMSNFG